MIPTKLWRRLGLTGTPPLQPDDELGRLGNWSTQVAMSGAGELVLFVNQRTLSVVVVELAPVNPLLLRFTLRLGQELERNDIRRAMIDEELAALAEPRLGKNTDRSLTGTVNDLVFQAEVRTESVRSVRAAIDQLQEELNDTPHVSRKPTWARDGLAELFATRH